MSSTTRGESLRSVDMSTWCGGGGEEGRGGSGRRKDDVIPATCLSSQVNATESQ